MKKGTIIALVLAILLLLSGGVMLVLGLSFAEDGTQSPKLNERTVPIADPFTDLTVKTADCDVSLHLVSTWEEARVEFAEYSQTKHQVSMENGTLRIELTDHRRWFDWVGVFWEDMQIRIYLPVGEYAGVHIITDTGDIEMPAYLTAQDVTLYSDTGDVYSEAQAKYVSAETDTGHIVVCACNPEFVVAKSDTGSIRLPAAWKDRNYHIETDTGRIRYE